MAKAKTVNYTPEMESRIREVAADMEGPAAAKLLAGEFGKTLASVRAKMSNLGVYNKPEAAKAESSRRKKADIVSDIVKAGVPLAEHEAEGLEKATSAALEKILARLTH